MEQRNVSILITQCIHCIEFIVEHRETARERTAGDLFAVRLGIGVFVDVLKMSLPLFGFAGVLFEGMPR